jgi:hypothetical protein
LNANDAYNWQQLQQEIARINEHKKYKALTTCLVRLESWMKTKQRQIDDSIYTICNNIQLNALEAGNGIIDKASDKLYSKVQPIKSGSRPTVSEFDAKYFSEKKNEKFKLVLSYLRKLEIHACNDINMRHEVINMLNVIITDQKQNQSANIDQSIKRDLQHDSQSKYIFTEI